MFMLYILRYALILVGFLIPGFLAPYVASHALFFLSSFVYAWTLLQPRMFIIVFSLLLLMIGDSLAGLKLGTTGVWVIFLALSALFIRPYWMKCSHAWIYLGYFLHVVLMVVFYTFIMPTWVLQDSIIIGAFSMLSFPFMMAWVRRYLAFSARSYV